MHRKVSRDKAEPLYSQLKNIIRAQIRDGKIRPGEALASERNLCGIHNVSHITVRQALVDLTREGLLKRVPGKGTFVNEQSSGHEKSLLGLMIPEGTKNATSPFMSELLLGIKAGIGGMNHSLVVYTESDAEWILDLEKHRVNGLILTEPREGDVRVSLLRSKNVPFVIVGRVPDDSTYSVDVDNVLVGYLVTRHLLAAGKKTIGMINGPEHLTLSADRLAGYWKSLREVGRGIEENTVINGEFSRASGYRGALNLAERGIEGIVCVDDVVASGALDALRKAGIEVPGDVAVTGCNDALFATCTRPTLTTVNIFPRRLGERAAWKLCAMISGERTERRTLIQGELVIRESTAGKKEVPGAVLETGNAGR